MQCTTGLAALHLIPHFSHWITSVHPKKIPAAKCILCPLPIQNIGSPKTAMLIALQSCKQVQWHLEQYASPSSASWSWQYYYVDFTIIIQSMAGMKRMDLVSLMLETSRWRVKFVLKGACIRGFANSLFLNVLVKITVSGWLRRTFQGSYCTSSGNLYKNSC